MSAMSIPPREWYEIGQVGRSVQLIDVRSPVELCEAHASFARNVPLDQLDQANLAAERIGNTQPLYVTCQSGARGKRACEKFSAAGYTNVVNVEGGTQAWDQACLPVVRGDEAISLERQVRIGAGSVVLIGSLLGYFAHRCSIAGIRGSRTVDSRNHRHLRHGNAIGQHALEPS